MAEIRVYEAGVEKPTKEEVRKLSDKLGLEIEEKDLQDYTDAVTRPLNAYTVLDTFPDCSLPVKYPRTPGYRPSREENKYNAWYYKTDIQGAAEGPLKGKTVVIKDNMPVAGVPMMNGSTIYEGYVPDYDATVVTRVLDAGGRITGKAVCENNCMSGSSFTASTGPVPNPLSPDHSAGGSSSGCAALIVGGEVDIAIANDVAGSIRIPASSCGLVGLKPTYGLVPHTGIPSMAPAMDHIGLITKTVEDCALGLEAIAGYDDNRDFRQHPGITVPHYSKEIVGDTAGIKIGLLTEGFDLCADHVQAVCRQTAIKLESKKIILEEISIPLHKTAPGFLVPSIYEGIFHTAIRNDWYPISGGPVYQPESALKAMQPMIASRKPLYSPTAKMASILAKYVHDKYGFRFYAKSQNLAWHLGKVYDEKLRDYDVILYPTLVDTARKLPPREPIGIKEYITSALGDVLFNTAQACSTGHPAITVNVGHSATTNLPVGLTVMGRKFDEITVLKVARALEEIHLSKDQ